MSDKCQHIKTARKHALSYLCIIRKTVSAIGPHKNIDAMRRTLTFSFIILSSLSAFAQSGDKTATLGEVVVKAAKVVSKPDGVDLYPTEAQRTASSNGYAILQKLSLPNIRIDATAHTISAIDNKGSVQIRINGIVADVQEMVSLNPKSIIRISFINNPGVRYGEGTAYVIDIVTRRSDRGYTLGTDVTAALTALSGNGMAYGKWNTGKSELSLAYSLDGHKLTGMRSTETADYTLNDGSVYTISRYDVATQRKRLGHDMKLTYNWADSTACVFQVSLSSLWHRTPGDYSKKTITDGADLYTATSRESGSGYTPVADLYFFRQLTPRQTLTANAVGTYIATKADNYYDERSPYSYHVDGKSASLLSELIYENRLKPFTLSAGLNYRFKHTKNIYTGDADALTDMNSSTIYAFTEMKGQLCALQYTLGTGTSYIHYRQGLHNYDYWTFRPKATLAYGFAHGMQLNYTFGMSDRVSRIAMVSDATVRNNSMEWTIGNPDLKPNRELEHTLRLSFDNDRWQTFVDGYYKHCVKPNMALYERTDDDRFIYTQVNQKAIDVLQFSAYAAYWAIPERLQLTGNGGLYRCFNFGYAYTHCSTSWFWQASAVAYLGHFTLVAQADNGYSFLEGENKGFNGGTNALQASYQLGNCQLSLTWLNPLTKRYKMYESEILNRNLHKHAIGIDRDRSNSLMLNVAWRISHGKKRETANKAINLNDSDNGIIK